MNFEDKILVLQLIEGDAKAFEKIFKKYYRILYSYVLEILENQLFVDDVIEDVFVTLWIKRAQLSVERSLQSYLITAAKNASLDFIRKKNVRDGYKSKIEKKYEIEADYELFRWSNQNPQQLEELKEIIEKEIGNLPRKCRKVFKLSRYFKLTNKEIAHRLNISENTVEKHMGTALTRLREVVRKYYT